MVNVFRHPDLCFLTPPWPDPIKPDDRIDISHESLIHHWDRLRDWVLAESRQAEMYRRLDRDAALHAEGEAGLWAPPQLDLALDWKEIQVNRHVRFRVFVVFCGSFCLPVPCPRASTTLTF